MNETFCGSGCPESRTLRTEPMIASLDCLARRNSCFRREIWTGNYFQVTLMCIPAGGEIGLECHEDTDQLLCIAEGCAVITMGKHRACMMEQKRVGSGCAVIIPAGTWHNLCNVGRTPLRLYSLYAPPQHPAGTAQRTKEDAEQQEKR